MFISFLCLFLPLIHFRSLEAVGSGAIPKMGIKRIGQDARHHSQTTIQVASGTGMFVANTVEGSSSYSLSSAPGRAATDMWIISLVADALRARSVAASVLITVPFPRHEHCTEHSIITS
jgi:hypothetical protein